MSLKDVKNTVGKTIATGARITNNLFWFGLNIFFTVLSVGALFTVATAWWGVGLMLAASTFFGYKTFKRVKAILKDVLPLVKSKEPKNPKVEKQNIKEETKALNKESELNNNKQHSESINNKVDEPYINLDEAFKILEKEEEKIETTAEEVKEETNVKFENYLLNQNKQDLEAIRASLVDANQSNRAKFEAMYYVLGALGYEYIAPEEIINRNDIIEQISKPHETTITNQEKETLNNKAKVRKVR